jgi:hypothetical protein
MTAAAMTMMLQNHHRFSNDLPPLDPCFRTGACIASKGADARRPSLKNALREPRSFIYLPGVGVEMGKANVADADAVGAGVVVVEEVGLADALIVAVGGGVGVGGGGIIFSQ